MVKGINLANSSTKNKRRELDFYPTPSEVTHALLQFLELKKMCIWECACGDGAMSRILEQKGHEVISTDLRKDTGYGEGGVDFLKAERHCDAIITNPPFSDSQDFIEHATRQAEIVAMVLKSQYWHVKKRLKLFNSNPPAFVLPLTWRPDFMGGSRGGSPTMEVHWTVWIKGCNNTRYIPLVKPNIKEETNE